MSAPMSCRPFYRTNRLSLSLMSMLILLLIPLSPAHSHFKLNLNVRILHVEHLADGLRVYLRTPMPYLVADLIGPEGEDGLPAPAPFTRNAFEDEQVMHFVDPQQFTADPLGLGALAGRGLDFQIDGERIEETVEQVRIYRVGTQPDFSTIDAARGSFAVSPEQDPLAEPLYVGDTTVDVVLRYAPGDPVRSYTLSSTLDPGLPGQEDTANLILDYRPGSTNVFRARGLLSEPIEITHSLMSAMLTFVKEGFHHILIGADHVIFVICMILGALYLGALVWRVTGFTVGHSITLTLGFFGFVPQGDWFIPAVETGIALTIIWAAVMAMRPITDKRGYDRKMFFVTAAVGLLHGLGFSFVLHEILNVDSPDIWQSLLAFNVGIEFGQLAIVLVAWPLFKLVQRFDQRAWRLCRNGLAIASIVIASYWTIERVQMIVS